jgi:hypothetical protein
MPRPLNEIAADIEQAEQILKNSIHNMMLATAQIAGTALPAEPHIPSVPMVLKADDGREIILGHLAAEIRDHG